MKQTFATAALLVLAGSACSSAADPKGDITLLVTNSSCVVGHCDSLEVLAFPTNQPLTPGGFWSIDLGLLTTSQACFTLPGSATFRIIGVNDDGTRDTTTLTWSMAVPLALGVIAPSGSRIQASPSTSAFVPMLSEGWRVILPGAAPASADAGCTPSS